MMPKVRRTRECVVVPLATNERSPVVAEPSINAPSVSAEMVVHCEDSTERRAPPSMVVEKTRDIHTDELSFLNNQSKQSHPRNSMSLWKCRAGVTWRNYVSIISHGWGNTFRKVMMKSNRKTKKNTKGRNSYKFIDAQCVDLSELYRDHELLYNKEFKTYKDTRRKQRLLEGKAASLRPPCTGKFPHVPQM